MFRDVQPFGLGLVGHPQAGEHADDLEDDEADDGVVHDREADRLDLDDELLRDALIVAAEALAAQRGLKTTITENTQNLVAINCQRLVRGTMFFQVPHSYSPAKKAAIKAVTNIRMKMLPGKSVRALQVPIMPVVHSLPTPTGG